MRLGTRTVLFGFHCFWIHPFYVAAAWYRLYGIPYDPRLWLCFLVHDLGYLGKANIDGPEGERHPELGAWLMSPFGAYWSDLCLYHSRSYADRDKVSPSKLCAADKLSILLTPPWLMHRLMALSGELDEALQHTNSVGGKFYDPNRPAATFQEFHSSMCRSLQAWLKEYQSSGCKHNICRIK